MPHVHGTGLTLAQMLGIVYCHFMHLAASPDRSNTYVAYKEHTGCIHDTTFAVSPSISESFINHLALILL